MSDKINGACHCGAVTFEVSPPEFAVSCNCSMCRRYAALWAHCPPNEGAVLTGHDHLDAYSWADHMIDFQSCKTCGCVTHWSSAENTDQKRIAVNLRMASLEVINSLHIRHFDGADTWEFLD
ncbi:GFA family protein [Aliiroseovarius sp. M344]|uniref:GFA family protein n=1 Tax=Aliiroseovarius sp. M344 TaxID=2867010 RepID=UPI0021ADDAE1|nr:GFA family protein [Aliiroseovarius sp. M344]UWQ14946.1 GFA family protein [Aliiroseovarius sp. M344]